MVTACGQCSDKHSLAYTVRVTLVWPCFNRIALWEVGFEVDDTLECSTFLTLRSDKEVLYTTYYEDHGSIIGYPPG